MSLQMLLTLGVAGGIWVVGALLYLLTRGARKLIRKAAGRPAPLGSGLQRVGEGVGALIVFLVATLTSITARVSNALWNLASRWWREAAQPSLVEAREMGIARMTLHPEDSGRFEVLAQVSPVLLDEVFAESEEEAEQDMQLV